MQIKNRLFLDIVDCKPDTYKKKKRNIYTFVCVDRVCLVCMEIIGICGITDPHKSPIKAERRDAAPGSGNFPMILADRFGESTADRRGRKKKIIKRIGETRGDDGPPDSNEIFILFLSVAPARSCGAN